jgi:hypothetical protein
MSDLKAPLLPTPLIAPVGEHAPATVPYLETGRPYGQPAGLRTPDGCDVAAVPAGGR